jgi:cation diffusion facilitator CzcD-associated flavoprotein CzcO
MKTVGVIGMGPAGLATVKELKEAGFEVKGLDRSCRVGGRWAIDGELPMGVWKELCLNATRRGMEFSDYP